MQRGMIGKRIKYVRERSQLSQQELAKLMGWKSHASIVAVENGRQELKTWELLKLASLLYVSPEELYEERDGEEKPRILWRNKGKEPKDVAREEQRVLQHYQNYLFVEQLAEASSSYRALPREVCDIETAGVAWASQLADRVYHLLQLGNYPADTLAKCLEETFGVLLLSRSLESGSAACSRNASGAVILLNEKDPVWRQPFSLAHELFHLITWDSELIVKIEKNKKLFQKNETLADAFAAALLMPSQMMSLDIQNRPISYSLIVALAMKYHVSKQAMLFRLCYLRYIDQKAVDSALKDKEFAEQHRSTFQKAFASFCCIGNRFLRLAYLAYEKGRLSKARLAEMLEVKLMDLDEFLLEQGLYLTHDKEIETCHH